MRSIAAFLFICANNFGVISAQHSYEVVVITQLFLSSNFTTTYNFHASNTIDLIDEPVAGYVGTAISLHIRRPLSKYLMMQTGVGYQHSGLINQRKYPEIFTEEYVAKVDYRDLVFPLQLCYAITQKTNNWYVQGGLVPSILLSRAENITRYKVDNSSVTTTTYFTTNYRLVNLSLTVSAGYQFHVSENFDFLLQPTVTCNLYGARLKSVDIPINWHLYNFGITLGLVIK